MGLYANWERDMVNRMYNQNLTEQGPKRKVKFVGGGMSLFTFGLRFLWEQHQLFHNLWSASNDGFDLAKYHSTTFYLPPARDNTYIFWWDVDYNQVKMEDFWRTQPALLFGWKNKVIVRPRSANNHRTKKVTIKPPATISNQWRYQGSWMDLGLFMFGVTILDWTFPFGWGRNATDIPHVAQINCWKISAFNGAGSTAQNVTMYYAHWRDTGQNNYIMAQTVSGKNDDPSEIVNLGGFRRIHAANDLPYWITYWGQNTNFNFDDESDKLNNASGWTAIYWYDFKNPHDVRQMDNVPQKIIYLLNQKAMYTLAASGPFIQLNNTVSLQIPLFYKSRWTWGGASMTRQPVSNIIHFAPSQVAVRNPASIAKSIITPWDCDQHGILTEQALRRFLEPSGGVDARRPLPVEEQLKEDEPYTSSAESAQESETDEEGPENQQELIKALKRCRARIDREQHERHRLRQLFRSLIKQE